MNKTMTKEEYVASIRELEEIITKYREQEKRLKEQYINENKMFEVNEKVKITTPAFRRAIPDENGRRYLDEECKYGFVEDYEVDNQGNIKYILARMNATGKKSQHRTYYTDLDVLEKVKEKLQQMQINMNSFKMKFLKYWNP